MKLTLLLILTSFSTFASNHMIRFDLDQTNKNNSTFDYRYKTDDNGSATTKKTTIDLNYAYAIAKQFQIGFTYRNATADNDIVKGNELTIGFDFYYSLDEDIIDSQYIGLHLYNIKVKDNFVTAGGSNTTQATNDGDKTARIALEYGKRFFVRKFDSLSVSFAPSVVYSMDNTKFKGATKDRKVNELVWNLLKFDFFI